MIYQTLPQQDTTTNSEPVNQNNEVPDEQEDAGINQLLLPNDVDDSIADRFVRSHEIRLMPELPEISDRLNFMTIITPEGLFQLNQETHTLKRLLDANQLDQLGLTDFVESSELSTPEEGTLIHETVTLHTLTLEQLRALERAVIDAGGRSVIGYTLSESIWIRIAGSFFREQYPPKSENYSRRWLIFINKLIIQDLLLSFKVTILIHVLFIQLGLLLYPDSQFLIFSYQHMLWLFIAYCTILTLNMILLRGTFFPKVNVIFALNSIRRIEQNTLGLLGFFLFEPLSLTPILLKKIDSKGNIVIPALLVFIILSAIALTFSDNDSLFIMPALNVFHRPKLGTFFYSFRYALMTSSFFSMGIVRFVYDSYVFYENDDDNVSEREKVMKIVTEFHYSIFIATFLMYLARYPHAPKLMQIIGRYAGNINNALSNVFLINFALCVTEFYLFASIAPSMSPNVRSKVFLAYFCSQPILFLCAFMAVFPTTSNLPELSIEPVPPEKTYCETITECVKPLTLFFQRSREMIATIEMWDFFRNRQVAPVSDNPMINAIHAEANVTSLVAMEI